MPRPVDKTQTVDLHAPWWSDAKEASGRYLERWVVRQEMSERNEQNIAANLRPVLRVASGGRGATSEMIMNEIPFSRLYTLIEMTVEVTDETGTALHFQSKDVLSSFPKRDTEWVADQMEKLYAAPSLEPTEEDNLAADRLRQQAEFRGKPVPESATGEAQAAESFRAHRKNAV